MLEEINQMRATPGNWEQANLSLKRQLYFTCTINVAEVESRFGLEDCLALNRTPKYQSLGRSPTSVIIPRK